MRVSALTLDSGSRAWVRHLMLAFRLAVVCVIMTCMPGEAFADTALSLYKSFAGNVNFVGTEATLRTSSNYVDPCAVVTNATTATGSNATSATISGIPSGATIKAAYLYWTGSGSTPDYNVTFNGNAVTASRQYALTFSSAGTTYNFFNGVADVTSIVASKGNGTYTFANLTIDGGTTYCNVAAVLGGWALVVIYSHSSEEYRVLNLYEGFQSFQYSNVTVSLSNFKIPATFTKGKIAHITWEGDPDLSGSGENLTFNGTTMSDSNNPVNNQFNSVSTITSSADTASYGIDFDAYDLTSPIIQSGQTSASTNYSTDQDLVLLSAEIIAIPNVAVADLGITMTRNNTLEVGQTATYTLGVTNNGPTDHPGTITVTDTLPSSLSLSSWTGSGWSCGSSGQTVTCTYAAGLNNGASAPSIVLTVAVASNANGTKTNTATVAGILFDNVSTNDTASDTYTINADLALAMTRNTALVNGSTASYTLDISNGGPSSEPGPITVTDTLPTGMSFSSYAGTGWSCSASGQAVTCTKTGSLASGASTASLTIVVNVTAVAGTSLTNTATVSGTSGLDPASSNNTVSDTYTVIAALYAYYKMDETSWNGTSGEVVDSGDSGRNASRLGTTITTDQTTKFGHDCRGAVIASNTTKAALTGMATPFTVNALSGTPGAGTIAFWYYNNAAWNLGGNSGSTNNRTLVDGSSGSSTKSQFWLVLTASGALQFSFTNGSSTTLQTVSGTAHGNIGTYAAGNWHHIAITWNLNSGSTAMRIYVDGNLENSNPSSGLVLSSVLGTLYVGDSKTGGVSNPDVGSSANGIIDEVRFYAAELSASQITEAMNLSHTCSTPDHYELSLPSNSITCATSTVTVTACADGTSPCTNKFTGVNGYTASLATSGATLGNNTVTFDATGVATTTLAYPTATNGVSASVTLSNEVIAASNSRKCCPDGTSCSVANSCSTIFSTAGFIFSSSVGGAVATIPTQTAGTSSSTYYLRAVKTSTTTQTCEAALAGSQQVSFAYECLNPSSCYSSNQMTVSGGASAAISGNNSGSVSNYQTVAMTFDANGNAPFTLNYSDVGQTKLWVKKTVDVGSFTGSNGYTLSGSSNAFVTKPAGFKIAAVNRASDNFANPQASGASGTVFAKAGDAFSVTIAAITSGGSATPAYGHESPSAESVKLTPSLVSPSGGQTGSIGGGPFGTFSNGSATGNFTWSEVGVIKLIPEVFDGDYLGAGAVNSSNTPDLTNIGRFTPHHFGVTGTLVNRADATADDGFTYMGEPMALTLAITAYNANEGTTQNYSDATGYSKVSASQLTSESNWFATNCNGSVNHTECLGLGAVDQGATSTALTTRLALTNTPTLSWTAGVGTFSGQLALARPSSTDAVATWGPYDSLHIGAAPYDSDQVTLNTGSSDTSHIANLDADLNGINERRDLANTKVRLGRLKIDSGHGSELLTLPLGMTAQYWNGTLFVRNTLDNSTRIAASDIALSNWKTLSSGDTHITSPSTTISFAQGASAISLGPPGQNKSGSVDLNLNSLSSQYSYLPNTRPNTGATAARARFGVFKGNTQIIYIRENY